MNTTVLEDYVKAHQMELTKTQLEQFVDYYRILCEWNQVMNLTAITDWDEVVCKHFIDSITVMEIYGNHFPASCIDVGTGAGFPGLPLKILYPETKVVLADSLGKRVQFLNHVIEELSLKQITAIHSRAEDLAKDNIHREHYELCVSRAVANLATLAEYCLPFVSLKGSFIAYKSEKLKEELSASKKAIKVLGGEERECREFVLTGTDAKRCLYIVEKVSHTPGKYPRKAGTAAKEPIQ